MWDGYFDEALNVNDNKRFKQALFGRKPSDLYQEGDNAGVPVDEDAENALYALGKQQAEKQMKNRNRIYLIRTAFWIWDL